MCVYVCVAVCVPTATNGQRQQAQQQKQLVVDLFLSLARSLLRSFNAFCFLLLYVTKMSANNNEKVAGKIQQQRDNKTNRFPGQPKDAYVENCWKMQRQKQREGDGDTKSAPCSAVHWPRLTLAGHLTHFSTETKR